MSDLAKLCPFCGNDAEMGYDAHLQRVRSTCPETGGAAIDTGKGQDDCDVKSWFVRCSSCAIAPEARHSTQVGALDMWNTRLDAL